MENLANGPDMPMGLGMALAQNRAAMEAFAAMTPAAQQAVIEHTHQVHSKQEMQAYVASLVSGRPGSQETPSSFS